MRRAFFLFLMATATASIAWLPARAQNGQLRSVQEVLQAEGFEPGVLDGVMGPKTRHAIELFQLKSGLPPTGDLDADTLSHLNRDKLPPPDMANGPSSVTSPAQAGALAGHGTDVTSLPKTGRGDRTANGVSSDLDGNLPGKVTSQPLPPVPASETVQNAPPQVPRPLPLRTISSTGSEYREEAADGRWVWAIAAALVFFWWRARKKRQADPVGGPSDPAVSRLSKSANDVEQRRSTTERPHFREPSIPQPSPSSQGSHTIAILPPGAVAEAHNDKVTAFIRWDGLRGARTARSPSRMVPIGDAVKRRNGSSIPPLVPVEGMEREVTGTWSGTPSPRMSADLHNSKVAEFIRRRAARGELPTEEKEESGSPANIAFGRRSSVIEGATSNRLPASRTAVPPTPDVPGAARSKDDGVRWIASDETVEVAGRSIGGMVYFGSPRSGAEPDNALIDPGRPVASPGDDYGGAGLPYWPNYSRIDPRSRATYLSWLASGRCDRRYDVGYVFLYFYGLERRFFVDNPGESEKRAIVAEVERLLSVYGESASLRRYLEEFLQLARLSLPDGPQSEPSFEKVGYEIPVAVRVAIGSMMARGTPIGPEWMLSWLMTHPEVHLRTPVRRALPEFKKLFALRFAARYPDGLKVVPPKKKLLLEYQAASGNFRQPLDGRLGTFPDISVLSKPVTVAQAIAEGAIDQLDAFSRFLGRNPDGRGTAEGHFLLPEALRQYFPCAEAEKLRDWLDWIIVGGGFVAVTDLSEKLQGSRAEKLTKAIVTDIAHTLGGLQVGFSPDPRFFLRGPKLGESVKLFRLPAAEPGDRPTSPAYSAMLLSVFVGAFIAHADGSISDQERRQLRRLVSDSGDLSATEKARLVADLDWMLEAAPDLALFRRNIQQITEEARRNFGRIALSTAGADGHIDPKEIGAIQKLYRALGLDTGSVYADLHGLMADAGPVTVIKAEPTPREHSIPQPAVTTPNVSSVILDQERVSAIMADTARVSAVLGDIFAGDEEDEQANPATPPGDDDATASDFAGLDAKHRVLAQELLGRPAWSALDYERLAAHFGLLPAGALETLNEWAFGRWGEPLAEEADGLELNADILEQLQS